MLEAVIFDMDGLMLDTEIIAKNGWKEVGKMLGVDLTEELIESVIGLDAQKTGEAFKKRLGEGFDYEKARAMRLEYSLDYLKKNGVPIKKGLFELLDFLKEKHIKCAVATSTAKLRAEQNLESAKVFGYFEAVVGGDMIKRGKPEPDIFLKAAELLSCKANECIVLEDSPNGILAAYRGGFKTIMVPDLVRPNSETEKMLYAKCDSLLDVIEIIKEEL